MSCEHSKDCSYYRTYRYKSSDRQSRLLVESYCEGTLHTLCRRLQCSIDYCREAPEDLAPNGYRVGTHKKMKADRTRKFERYKIKDGACMLQILDSGPPVPSGVLVSHIDSKARRSRRRCRRKPVLPSAPCVHKYTQPYTILPHTIQSLRMHPCTAVAESSTTPTQYCAMTAKHLSPAAPHTAAHPRPSPFTASLHT